MRAKTPQRDINPFKNTDSNKRYCTYDYYLRRKFGGKVAKITLDCGFTCPNIDGARARGGCIYCSGRGSGDFSPSACVPIREQFEIQRAKMSEKWRTDKYIPYLQAHTNTYAPIERLREVYEQVLALPDVVGMSIATRADCIDSECLEYLSEIADRTSLTVELGLQSVHDSTARLINRAHTYAEFCETFARIREKSERIGIGVHLIDGLPREDKEMMLTSAREVGALHPDQIKIHLLHVLRDTPLAQMYERGEYTPLSQQEYTDIVVSQLELIPSDVVIGRVTGDGAAPDLIAPMWSRRKISVINDIDKLLFSRNTYQGRLVDDAQR